jgi:hypothetical protein
MQCSVDWVHWCIQTTTRCTMPRRMLRMLQPTTSSSTRPEQRHTSRATRARVKQQVHTPPPFAVPPHSHSLARAVPPVRGGGCSEPARRHARLEASRASSRRLAPASRGASREDPYHKKRRRRRAAALVSWPIQDRAPYVCSGPKTRAWLGRVGSGTYSQARRNPWAGGAGRRRAGARTGRWASRGPCSRAGTRPTLRRAPALRGPRQAT